MYGARDLPHLTNVEWDALNHLVVTSAEAFLTLLMKSSCYGGQSLDIYEFMARVLAESNQRGLTSSRPSRSVALKMETSIYSGENTN